MSSNNTAVDEEQALKDKLKQENMAAEDEKEKEKAARAPVENEKLQSGDVKQPSATSSVPTATPLERGTTVGSMDAADIPVPTTLQRNNDESSRPGAFARAGPGGITTTLPPTMTRLRPTMTALPPSIPVSSEQEHQQHENIASGGTVLVTAQLVVEDEQEDDVEIGTNADTTSTTTASTTTSTTFTARVQSAGRTRSRPIKAAAAVAEEDLTYRNKSSPGFVFWTRRNVCIMAAVALIVLGVVTGLSVALVTAIRDEEDSNDMSNIDVFAANASSTEILTPEYDRDDPDDSDESDSSDEPDSSQESDSSEEYDDDSEDATQTPHYDDRSWRRG